MALFIFSLVSTSSINWFSLGFEYSWFAVKFDAPVLGHREFRSLPPAQVKGFAPSLVGIIFILHRKPGFIPLASCSGLRPGSFSQTTMPSADFCIVIHVTSWQHQSLFFFIETQYRPPRVMRTYFPAYARHIYVHAFRIGLGL